MRLKYMLTNPRSTYLKLRVLPYLILEEQL